MPEPYKKKKHNGARKKRRKTEIHKQKKIEYNTMPLLIPDWGNLHNYKEKK